MEKKESIEKEEKTKVLKYAQDEKTGKFYKLEPEKYRDTIAATISILYSIAMLIFFSWLLIDFCIGNRSLLRFLIPQNAKILESSLFRLIAYTVIGGGLGGTINGIQSVIIWHCERGAFGWRFVWKNITLPLLGAVLAAIVYAIIQGGIAAFGGGYTIAAEASNTQAFSAFAVGAIAGYGSHKVFRWLDEQVNKIFRISPVSKTRVPDLKNKTKDEAETLLNKAKLSIGEINYKPVEDLARVDKVISQNPGPDSKIPVGGSVDIILGSKA